MAGKDERAKANDGVIQGLVQRLSRRLRSYWFEVEDSLWFLPAVMTVGAVVLAFIMLAVDRNLVSSHTVVDWLLFSGGAEGARGVLTTIASTMITVATTAFSITIVALQLGSSQYSPRILRGFTGDRGNQLVLGMFISTFAFTIVVLRAVKSEAADRVAFVPTASVTVAIVLAFAAIGSLIYFFHHASRVIQAPVVINRTSDDLHQVLNRYKRANERNTATTVDDPLERDDLVGVALDTSGYVISIDYGMLARLGARCDTVITVNAQVGDFLLSNSEVVSVTPDWWEARSEEEQEAFIGSVRGAWHLGIERTLEYDLRLGFRQVADIAVKALSPGINDPTTAISAIDALAEGLVRARELPHELRFESGGTTGGVRYWTLGFPELLDDTIPQIRHFGAGDAGVIAHLLTHLGVVSRHTSEQVRLAATTHARLAMEEANDTLVIPADRNLVHSAGSWALGGAE